MKNNAPKPKRSKKVLNFFFPDKKYVAKVEDVNGNFIYFREVTVCGKCDRIEMGTPYGPKETKKKD